MLQLALVHNPFFNCPETCPAPVVKQNVQFSQADASRRVNSSLEMQPWFTRVWRGALIGALTWLTAAICLALNTTGSIVAMLLVLEVLAFATVGDWLLAVLASAAATTAFSYFYVDSVGFRISTTEGAITFATMALTALTGSRLSIRAQRRAEEAIHRRQEMEKMQQLGSVMLASDSVAEAAAHLVARIVELFGVQGARLRVKGIPEPFAAGDLAGPRSEVRLRGAPNEDTLELYGDQPSEETRQALANLINLVVDRARSSEERARIEASRRGDALRNTVLNALAHNFKTPLTSIKAASSALRGTRELSPSANELAAVIDEEADRLSQLISDSLDLAKIESHRENPRLELCEMSDIVAAVTSKASRYLRGRSLVIDVSEDLPPVWGDRFLFEQMLTQVVDNAWKYSRPGAEIRIDASLSAEALLITVQNEGTRIPDEEGERIFDKFYRGVMTRSQVEGTGLGLAIARTIVEAHGGTVWLDSRAGGPTFCFSLPMDKIGRASDRKPHDLVDRR